MIQCITFYYIISKKSLLGREVNGNLSVGVRNWNQTCKLFKVFRANLSPSFVISMIVQNIKSVCVIIEAGFRYKRNGVHRTMKAA